jgi:phosphoribosylanthranilate isomerase
MFRVKICGITNVDDALVAAEAGADAIGLNFFAGSKRCIDLSEAKKIADAVGGDIDRVGVFVNAATDAIQQTCEAAELHCVQLHGNESPEFLHSLDRNLRILRARRLDARGVGPLRDDVTACSNAVGASLVALLLDADAPGEYGGTGHTVDWHAVAGYREWIGEVPLVLAGGLTPENVAEAIHIVQPHGVDVASGVESMPGKKDVAKMRDFIAAARQAFSAR